VPLNRKRRIFRANSPSAPRRGLAAPSLGVIAAAAGGLVTIGLAGWLFMRPTYAPALAPTTSQIAAPAAEAAVVDGDTLRLGQQVVRLSGVAAPERGTPCGSVDCGAAAANALSALIGGHGVDCRIDGHDRLGRPLGVCQASGVELNQALVHVGWAHAITASLRASENDARQARRGLWQSSL
jgi:endonuclease YncB( thermonuclease family)